MQKKQQGFHQSWDQEDANNANDSDEEDGADKEKRRELYAQYDVDPETENEKSQREKGVGDTGEMPGQEDVGYFSFYPTFDYTN